MKGALRPDEPSLRDKPHQLIYHSVPLKLKRYLSLEGQLATSVSRRRSQSITQLSCLLVDKFLLLSFYPFCVFLSILLSLSFCSFLSFFLFIFIFFIFIIIFFFLWPF